MGNEQGIPTQDPPPGHNQAVRPQPSTPKQNVDHELLIVIRGLRKTGKTTLVTRMRGFPFNENYDATNCLEATEIPWFSPQNENVNVTAWDVVENALLPLDSSRKMDLPDATTVDTLKRADGLIILIDTNFSDTVQLAEKLIREAPTELPIVVFSNFGDLPDFSPVIPEPLMRFMGRFYFIPGSLKTNQGLVELSKWLAVPLIASKRRLYYNMFKALDEDLMTLSLEYTTTAEFFVELDSAKEHAPKFIPPPPQPHSVEINPQSNEEQQTFDDSVPNMRRQQRFQNRPQVNSNPQHNAKENDDDDGNFWSDDDTTPIRRQQQPSHDLFAEDDSDDIKPNPLVHRKSEPKPKTKKKVAKRHQKQEPTQNAIRTDPEPKSVIEIADPEKITKKNEEEPDQATFWSDDDTPQNVEEEIKKLKIEIPEEDDDIPARPNPLVKAKPSRIKKVIKTHNEEEKGPVISPPLSTSPIPSNYNQEMTFQQNQMESEENMNARSESIDDYGDLDSGDTNDQSKPKERKRKKIIKKTEKSAHRRVVKRSSRTIQEEDEPTRQSTNDDDYEIF